MWYNVYYCGMETNIKKDDTSEALIIASLKPSLTPFEEFAKAAMQGLLSSGKYNSGVPEFLAEKACEYADATLTAINKRITEVEFETA